MCHLLLCITFLYNCIIITFIHILVASYYSYTMLSHCDFPLLLCNHITMLYPYQSVLFYCNAVSYQYSTSYNCYTIMYKIFDVILLHCINILNVICLLCVHIIFFTILYSHIILLLYAFHTTAILCHYTAFHNFICYAISSLPDVIINVIAIIVSVTQLHIVTCIISIHNKY